MTLTPGSLLDVAPVVPVVVIEDAASAVPLAQALLRGGVGIIEITLRTAAALEAVKRVAAEVPGIVTGAGTVTSPEQAEAARAAGAQFLVTPGTTPRLLDATLDSELPVLAGAGTISEMLALADRGLEAMKFFPAEASGGRAYLAAVQGPLPHLRFCPTGGISPENAASYLAMPNVGCVGGSWLTPKDAVAAGDWGAIEDLARATTTLRP